MKGPAYFLGVLLGVAASAGAASGIPPRSAGQRLELEMLKQQLAEPDRTAKTKHEAAVLLLNRTYPQAAEALRDFLADATNRAAQIAIAQAIAESGVTRQEFVQPLLEMLTGEELSVRQPAANALAAYKNHGVLDEFIKLVSDRKTDHSTRLAIIAAMQRILDKRAIDALVRLLGDADEAVRNAAGDSLIKLTNIRAFGRDPRRWRKWWQQNKDKKRSDWLADLAENLARANLDFERRNASLRRRLASAMNDLYAATPPAGRDALLAEMLKDSLSEVRLVGAQLTLQRVGNSQPLPEALKAQIRAKVADPDASVRRQAALLLANVGDDQAVKLLAGRLKGEQAAEVRQSIYQALGLLRDPQVWGQLVAGLNKEDNRVASAVAAALARVAEKNSLDETRRAAAAAALKRRYQAARNPEDAPLREALLTAMGHLHDPRLAGLIHTALKDPAATVRLSAIKALQELRQPASAAAVTPLTADPDRGVRLAAVAALGALGAPEHLETVLGRTDARVEPDATVRQQAWNVLMGLLEKADAAKLELLADQLAPRKDAREYLIQLLKLWVQKIPADPPDRRAPVRVQLGEALLSAGRPAEAARELADAYALLAKAQSPDAPAAWARWIEALLAADDVSAVTRIADGTHDAHTPAAVEALLKRLRSLQAGKDWDDLVRLAAPARQRLAAKLDAESLQWLDAALQDAKAQQAASDRQRVAALVGRLTAPDADAAEKDLLAMKDRALRPLLGELKRIVTAEKPDGALEKAVVKVLQQIDPRFRQYTLDAPLDQRRAAVDAWLKKNAS